MSNKRGNDNVKLLVFVLYAALVIMFSFLITLIRSMIDWYMLNNKKNHIELLNDLLKSKATKGVSLLFLIKLIAECLDDINKRIKRLEDVNEWYYCFE